MTAKDRQRWDDKWARFPARTIEPDDLLTNHRDLLAGGQALDIACGRGQNAIWLAGRGYSVLAVDISSVALDAARREAETSGVLKHIRFERLDLDHWSLPETEFDVICVFRYLDRHLFSSIRDGLRPGGLLFYRTRHLGFVRRHQAATKAYLLKPGELSAAFDDWQSLHYREGSEEVELIARKGDSVA